MEANGTTKTEETKMNTSEITKIMSTTKNLHGMDLSGMDLSGMDLSGANLSWASLDSCNLTGANLDTIWSD